MGIVAALGNTVQNIILATAIVNFPLYARVARAEANVRREAGFVQAARLSGNGEFRIVLAQVLPNIMPIMIVQMSLTMGYAILNAAGLSFIGLGVRPPTAEWGIMVAEGAAFMVSGEWWIAFFPGLALMIAVFCFNLLGDGLARHRRSAAADVRHVMTAIPLLDVRDLTVEFQTRRGIVQRGAARQHHGRQGRDRRHRRRIRLRQVGDVLRRDAHPRPRRPDRRRLGDVHQHRRAAGQRRRHARASRPRNLDDLPESARGAQPDPQGRPADRGRAAGARQGGAVGGDRKGHRNSRPGPHRAAARALSRLSVRTVRRHVPARRHRAGAGLPAAAADRRRADHRPRRHHAEDGDGADRRADARARHVDDPDHARSRPRRHLLRQGRGDGEGPRGRDRDRARHLHRAGASLHPQADARDAAARRVAARSAARGGRAGRAGGHRHQAHRWPTASRCWWSTSW